MFNFFFQVDGKTNAKIQSIKFNQFPIHRARFSADGEEFVASSHMTGNIQVYNLVSGKSKIIPHNKQMENGSYKVNKNVQVYSVISGNFIPICRSLSFLPMESWLRFKAVSETSI